MCKDIHRDSWTYTDRKMQTDKADAPTHAGTHTNTCKETTTDQFTETLRYRDTYGHSETHRLKRGKIDTSSHRARHTQGNTQTHADHREMHTRCTKTYMYTGTQGDRCT